MTSRHFLKQETLTNNTSALWEEKVKNATKVCNMILHTMLNTMFISIVGVSKYGIHARSWS